jgi:hypothetical protein
MKPACLYCRPRLCGEGWLKEVQKGDTMKIQWLLLVALRRATRWISNCSE